MALKLTDYSSYREQMSSGTTLLKGENTMPQMKTLALGCFLSFALYYCIFVLTPLARTSTQAQTMQVDEKHTISILLDEVRQLRLALQAANLNGYRAQITIERLRLQQERTDRLMKELEFTRTQINEENSNRAQVVESVKFSESRLAKEFDVTRRADIEQEYKMLKAGLERYSQEEQRLRERETQLSTQLQVEQAKLNEINGRLDTWEQQLEKWQVMEKSQPSVKRP